MNKVESKIDLRFDLEAAEALPAAVKAKLRKLCADRLDAPQNPSESFVMVPERAMPCSEAEGLCAANAAFFLPRN